MWESHGKVSDNLSDYKCIVHNAYGHKRTNDLAIGRCKKRNLQYGGIGFHSDIELNVNLGKNAV
jgi:hypothetical protein